ncbi:rRNA processing protein [Pseudogymnoascus australis]
MGSSARKKAEKKKDFKKPKLRVGKAKAKPDNFTDTSFKSRSITINQQSLTTSAPASSVQFEHYLSLASSSKSDAQRRDALSYLTTQVSSQPVNAPIPVSPSTILEKLLPLILDGSQSVRTHQLKFLRLLPAKDVGNRAEFALLYIRAGMTHLAVEIRNDALSVLEWLVEIAPEYVVSCPGGWFKTLDSFMRMMGWAESVGSSKWSAAAKVTFGKGGKSFPRQITVLAQFLNAGLARIATEEPFQRGSCFPLWDADIHVISAQASPFAHLNLFGPGRDEEGEMYTERESRQRVFRLRFQKSVDKGIESARKEGGEMGRAGAILGKVVTESMDDYDEMGNMTDHL